MKKCNSVLLFIRRKLEKKFSGYSLASSLHEAKRGLCFQKDTKHTSLQRPFSKRLDLALDSAQASLAPAVVLTIARALPSIIRARVSDDMAEPEAESKAEAVVSKKARD